jgi:hypothetical protein
MLLSITNTETKRRIWAILLHKSQPDALLKSIRILRLVPRTRCA